MILKDFNDISFIDNSEKTVYLYHGSSTEVRKPLYGFGSSDNDYGSGFYTTAIEDRAIEWACENGDNKAIVNKYRLDLTNLITIDLDNYGPMAWIAEVVYNRKVSGIIMSDLYSEFIKKYKINTNNADIIIGYRADDSYTDVIVSFFNGEITVDEVEKLFYKGELGVQYFIKSEKAFNSLEFIDSYTVREEKIKTSKIAKARAEVYSFLNNRRIAIMKRFVVPQINIIDAIDSDYVYDAKYRYYIKK